MTRIDSRTSHPADPVRPAAGTAVEEIAAELPHWPRPQAKELARVIAAHEHQGAYATFDADNTTYRGDLEESLLPFLELRGVLTRDTMDPSLTVVPFRDTADRRETLTEYYDRLCAIDDLVAYPWSAQIFSGFTLGRLKEYVDELMAFEGTLPGGGGPPRLSRGMRELYRALRSHGIEVYVVSAASEELVRMLLADPRYGYDVPPQNVIGAGALLRDPATGDVTSSRKEFAAGTYDQEALAERELTSTLLAPLTWCEGKPAAIRTYIDAWRGPVLAAGDTPASDGPMLLRSVDVERGGVRVWVDRGASSRAELARLTADAARRQRELGLPVTADRGWVTVTPEQIA
ncbi:haloacid dehalogenase-like hydrolase [Streptomyces sp. NPDC057694]|uniref:haloacid dehalogenase-like hydrolase n=1 Tax=Streptomyces sp. NPDC057694 TaxID=3346216 RepID=UPI0036BB7C97